MSVPLNILCVIVIIYFLLTFLEVMVSYLPSYFTFNSSLAVKSVHLKFLVIFDTTSRDVCKFFFGCNIKFEFATIESYSSVDSWPKYIKKISANSCGYTYHGKWLSQGK